MEEVWVYDKTNHEAGGVREFVNNELKAWVQIKKPDLLVYANRRKISPKGSIYRLFPD